MRRIVAILLTGSLAACGGDSKPLPPLKVGAEFLPLLVDTAGNLMMRRMAAWIDTAHVSRNNAGYLEALQLVQVDMKFGMSTTMRLRTQFNCADLAYRSLGTDSVSVTMDGVTMSDSVAKQVTAQQKQKAVDTTWHRASPADQSNSTMVGAICSAERAGRPAGADSASEDNGTPKPGR